MEERKTYTVDYKWESRHPFSTKDAALAGTPRYQVGIGIATLEVTKDEFGAVEVGERYHLVLVPVAWGEEQS